MPGDLDRSAEIAARIASLVEARSGYIRDNGVPADFALPDANWAYDARNPFLQLYRRVVRCDAEAIGQLRGFTVMFSGFNLYEMALGPTKIVERLDGYTDGVIAEALSRNLPFVEAWQRQVAGLPERMIFRPPRRFGEIGHEVQGVIVNYDTWAYQQRIKLLIDSGIVAYLDARLADRGKLRVLEIGGGYGALATWFADAFPGLSYTVLDIPECLLFSALYLSLPRPETRVAWGLEPVDSGHRFTANYQAPTLTEPFDLVINTLSMSEMSESQVRYYCRLIRSQWLRDGGLFFEQNQDNRSHGMLSAQEIIAEEMPYRRSLDSAALAQGMANIWSCHPNLPT
jgi:hypothetical protein